MCGLFGFVGTKPDLETLAAVARAAAGRGPDSWGILYDDGDGLRVDRYPGQFRGGPDDLRAVENVSIVLGHARLATMSSTELANAQPMLGKTCGIGHNGNIYQHRTMASLYGLEDALETDCDSELALRLLEAGKVREAFGTMGAIPYAFMAHRGDSFLVCSGGQPLYATEKPEGIYYCSMKRISRTLIMERKLEEGVIEEVTVKKKARKRPKAQKHNVGGQPTHLGPDGKPTTSFSVTRQAQPSKTQPISNVRWVDPSTLNSLVSETDGSDEGGRSFDDVREILLSVGWVRPLLITPDGDVVSGREELLLVQTDEEVAAISGGMVPIVVIDPKT